MIGKMAMSLVMAMAMAIMNNESDDKTRHVMLPSFLILSITLLLSVQDKSTLVVIDSAGDLREGEIENYLQEAF